MSAWKGVGTLELVKAFVWTCDNCGSENFEWASWVQPASIEGRGIGEVVDQAVTEAGGSAEALGDDRDGPMALTQVRCRHCGADFEATAVR